MATKLVIDSSVIVKWLNKTDEKHLEQADKVIQDVHSGKVVVVTSELAKFEVGNALLIKKKLSTQQVEVPLAGLFELPLEFISQSYNLARETYAIAKSCHITYYDAAFIALAKQEKATLVTDNIKHQGRVSEVKVIPLKNYK